MSWPLGGRIRAGVAALAFGLLFAAPAQAADGGWERAWGQGVNGGGAFGICTVASSCLTGGTGGLGGELYLPTGVAVDAGGNVYVADFANNRIQKFSATGVWDRAWGKGVNGGATSVCGVALMCQAGGVGFLGGEMAAPKSIAVDPTGNVYVADQSNNRVQKFDAFGTWISAWGKNVNGGGVYGVCTAAPSCLAGTTGGTGGAMSSPQGIATDADGNVYVTDSGNQRIQKFNSSGAWISAWGKNVTGGGNYAVCTSQLSCVAGTAGGLGGEMASPQGIGTDSAGNVYVGDVGNARIQKFSSTGTWERAWGLGVTGGSVFGICTVEPACISGAIGSLGGEMDSVYGIAVDAAGNVYAGDAFTNSRIQVFDTSGNWKRTWGKNVNGGGVYEVCTVASSCHAGGGGGLGGELNTPSGVAATPAGAVYVTDVDNNRIQKYIDAPPVQPPAAAPPGPTGQRDAALKKCKKKKSAKQRKRCRKRAKQLPV